MRTECSELRTEKTKTDTLRVRSQASLGEIYFTIKTAKKSPKVQCSFQYLENIGPTIEQTDQLIFDNNYWPFELTWSCNKKHIY